MSPCPQQTRGSLQPWCPRLGGERACSAGVSPCWSGRLSCSLVFPGGGLRWATSAGQRATGGSGRSLGASGVQVSAGSCWGSNSTRGPRALPHGHPAPPKVSLLGRSADRARDGHDHTVHRQEVRSAGAGGPLRGVPEEEPAGGQRLHAADAGAGAWMGRGGSQVQHPGGCP